TYGTDHPSTVAAMNNLVQDYLALKQYAEASAIAVPLAEASKRVFPEGHPVRAIAAATCGLVLCRSGRHAEAEPYLVSAYQQIRQKFGDGRYETERAISLLRELYDRWKKPE